MTKAYLRKLASEGLSIIPVNENKIPIGKWKDRQTKPYTPDEIEAINAPIWGMVTGINDIECIDVDLKVIVGLAEQKAWWDEYLSFLEDNIEGFRDKVVIARTMNAGYHIIYKCKEPRGSVKIAKLKDKSEAIIESRGKGGYVVLYDKMITNRNYHQIDYITETEREIIWSISRTYNYVSEPLIDEPKKSEYKPQKDTEISPWEDFNSRNSAMDLIFDEFTIVRNTASSYIIRRNGATSPHSGYIYKDSGCMYLFSTGTTYPHEKLLTPFAIYSYKYHNGDFTKAASELYSEGYGSRKMPKIEAAEPIPKEKIDRIKFPIEIFPNEIQQYIIQSSETLGLSIDYMGCSFLWVISLIIGNTIRIEVKPGWQEICTLWIAIVGKPGIGKTPSVNQMIFPLREANIREQKDYQKQYAKWREYEALDKKEKEHNEKIEKPDNKQFIVNDITLEALIDLHEQNPNAVGVFKDELAGWFKDMNKYRQGSDLEFWLSSWSGTSISLNRKTSKNAFVDKPFIPVIGGIQPGVFEEFTTGNNKDNGFVDRILISYPDLEVNYYNNNHMNPDLIEWYRAFIDGIRNLFQNKFLRFNDKGEIENMVAQFDNQASKEWMRIHDKLTDIQNSDEENEYMKSMLPKQKSYIPRFSMILQVVRSAINDDTNMLVIQKQSILDAEILSDYFINMSKLVKVDMKEKNKLRQISSMNSSMSPKEQVKAMYRNDPDFNRSHVAEILEVSRITIHRWVKEFENK